MARIFITSHSVEVKLVLSNYDSYLSMYMTKQNLTLISELDFTAEKDIVQKEI